MSWGSGKAIRLNLTSVQSELLPDEVRNFSQSMCSCTLWQMPTLDVMNSISMRLELLANGHTLSWATGFVLAQDGDWFLTTNKHVFSGKNAITGELLSPQTGAIPDQVAVHFHVNNDIGTTWFRQPINLFHGDEPAWISPFEDPETDVAFLPMPMPSPPGATPVITPLGKDSTLANVQEEAGMRVVILGFPDGMTKKTFFPIWKTGYIATEPLVDYDEQSLFLVDSYTSPGMSGSPVILVTNGGFKTKDGTPVLASPTQHKFLGIYSGRISNESTLARVWKAEEVLRGLAKIYIRK